MSLSTGIPMFPGRRISACCAAASLILLLHTARAQFTAPTQEELSMTSQPEVPGADAVLLLREEDTESKLYNWTTHVRLKVLTEAGKKYAHVELGQARWLVDPGQWQGVQGYKVAEIDARTIHPDGKVIPYTASAALKESKPTPGTTVGKLSFEFPDVTVGSILEYSYTLVNSDNLVFTPHWEVQSELFTRKEHFMWRPMRSDNQLVTIGDKKGRQVAQSIGWLPILPKDAVFTHDQISGTGAMAGEYGQMIMELKAANIPPNPKEPFMPPLGNTRYRVQFYYTAAISSEQYWKQEGKRLLGAEEEFIGPGPKVQAAAQAMVTASDSEEDKLKKIYAAVAKVENLTYTRNFLAGQDQAHGITPAKTTDDLWERQSGHSDQITELFIALARAAGMKAYLMDVANRNRDLFNPAYLNFGQLGDYVAIVKVNGKEQFFDPDVPMAPYGQLWWAHSGTAGVRMTESGAAELAQTPGQTYKDSRTVRVADLTLDEHGVAKGTVKLTWTGAPAMRLRQLTLKKDNSELQSALRAEAQKLLPKGTLAVVDGITNLEDDEKPLSVGYVVKAPVGSIHDGKLEIQAAIFEANSEARFTAGTRQTAVYFPYPYQNSDAVKISFAKGVSLQRAPASQKLQYQKTAAYSFSADTAADSITFRRDLVIGNGVYPVADYDELKTFFEQLETKDHEATVLALAGAGGQSGN